jgi:endonuclease G
VLDQTPELDDIDLSTARALATGNPPPLGPFKTYQVPISDIVTLTGLTLGPLAVADRLPTVPAARESADLRARWTLLQSTSDIRL